MSTLKTTANEPVNEQTSAIPRRSAAWRFGPSNPFSKEDAAWWKRHEPAVDRWLTELEEAGDPWWQSAEHAAYCLAASRELERRWDGFSVSSFLFSDLWEGGTVGIFGSAEKFFDQLVEALHRFVSDGIVEAPLGERWLAEMRDAREDFVRCYAEATPESESIAIARRHRVASLRASRKWPGDNKRGMRFDRGSKPIY